MPVREGGYNQLDDSVGINIQEQSHLLTLKSCFIRGKFLMQVN